MNGTWKVIVNAGTGISLRSGLQVGATWLEKCQAKCDSESNSRIQQGGDSCPNTCEKDACLRTCDIDVPLNPLCTGPGVFWGSYKKSCDKVKSTIVDDGTVVEATWMDGARLNAVAHYTSILVPKCYSGDLVNCNGTLKLGGC